MAIAAERGGFTHPLTTYTMCVAVENALLIAGEADLTGPQLAALMETRARHHWRKTGYYRLLGRFLFFAAEPHKRVKVFQRFYRLREGLVERFYAARSSPLDKARVLWGEPPVSIPAAILAMFNRGPPLKANALQIKSVFNALTVFENIRTAAQAHLSMRHFFRPAASFRETTEKVERIVEEVGLGAIAHRTAGTLSYGDVALLEMAIALASEPELLLLDEPICGMRNESS